MRFTFDEQQQELAEVARSFFVSGAPMDQVDAGPEAARKAWEHAVEALGVHLLGVPEEFGGVGGVVGLAAVLEQAGRVLYPAPLLTSVGYANGLLAALGGVAHKVLRDVAESGRAAAVVEDPAVRLEGDTVIGTAAAVVDAELADDLLVIADGAVVHVDASEVRMEPREGVDPSRRAARVAFPDVLGTVLARDAGEAVTLARRRAQALAAVEAVGGMRATLDSVVEHVSTRQQFGVPVGSFQAVQHRAVDMLLELDRATAGAYHAAWCVDAEPETLAWAAPLALVTAASGYGSVARAAIQLFGGIGFTWEHPAHRHFRRSVALASQFGTADQQLDAVHAAVGAIRPESVAQESTY